MQTGFAAGIVVFLLVEKLVRYVEDNSEGSSAWGHGHHHHHKKDMKLKDDDDSDSSDDKNGMNLEKLSESKMSDAVLHDSLKNDGQHEAQIRKVNCINLLL